MRCAARPSYVYAGGGTKPPISAASSRANSIVVRSSPSGPMICRPTGNPSSVKPIGAAVAGRPAYGGGQCPRLQDTDRGHPPVPRAVAARPNRRQPTRPARDWSCRTFARPAGRALLPRRAGSMKQPLNPSPPTTGTTALHWYVSERNATINGSRHGRRKLGPFAERQSTAIDGSGQGPPHHGKLRNPVRIGK